MKYLFFLLLLTITLTGCDKHWKNTKIKGKVVDANTGNPIGKADVAVFSYRGTTTSDHLFDETNESGDFEFKFKAWRTKDYFMKATHSEYFSEGENPWPPGSSGPVFQTQVETKQKSDPVLKLFSKSTLRVRFNPYPTFDSSKALIVDMPYYDVMAGGISPTQKLQNGVLIYGPNVVSGNTTHTVRYRVAKNGDTTLYSVSAYCRQNELKEISVDY